MVQHVKINNYAIIYTVSMFFSSVAGKYMLNSYRNVRLLWSAL